MPKDERELFERAMEGVRPIERDRHEPAIRPRRPVSISEREREVLAELDRVVSGEAPFELARSEEPVEGKVPGLDPRVMQRLRRGEFTVQDELDLHGTSVEAARQRVERFVLESQARGLRCVRIVHGRGRNSPSGVPVLKQSLPRWLSRGPARRAVLAFTAAAPRHGGPGASYLLLRSGPIIPA